MQDKITFIITSSGRLDLLERTMASFVQLNNFPIDKFLMHEDSGDWELRDVLLNKYKYFNHISIPHEKRGYSAALDYLFNLVETEYVFTCEDDWYFNGNPNFIGDSLKILKANNDIHQVWIRHPKDHTHPLGEVETIQGMKVRRVAKGYHKYWGGFSLNPGLRRMSDIKRFFPNGLTEFGDEIECSKHVEAVGYTAVSLMHSAIVHIGWDRHTPNFKV